MFKTKSEKLLALVLLITGLGLGGFTLFRNSDALGSLVSGDTEELIQSIDTSLELQTMGIEIREKYNAMKKELTVEGTDSDQWLTIRQDILNVFQKVGLSNAGDYQRITLGDTDKSNEDFKIMTYSIEQIICTSAQLGQLLYELEKSSNVMEIISCDVENLFTDTGQLGNRQLQDRANLFRTGLLSVNLEIARLIEYRAGEAPKKRTRTTR
ncbi:MAG: hypothetical protein RBU29_03990 [bacterium]|jgi:hypothetical protein|nr:hypothetical protein [bacterium]